MNVKKPAGGQWHPRVAHTGEEVRKQHLSNLPPQKQRQQRQSPEVLWGIRPESFPPTQPVAPSPSFPAPNSLLSLTAILQVEPALALTPFELDGVKLSDYNQLFSLSGKTSKRKEEVTELSESRDWEEQEEDMAHFLPMFYWAESSTSSRIPPPENRHGQ